MLNDMEYQQNRKIAEKMSMEREGTLVTTYRDGEWRVTRRGFYLRPGVSNFGGRVLFSGSSRAEVEKFLEENIDD